MDLYRLLPRRCFPILLLCLAGVALQGCGSSPTRTRVEADVIAAADVNKEKGSGRSLPIVVRIYELKTAGSFQDADFYSLYDREAETLGTDLLAREELNLRPGQQQRIERETAPGAQYLGVVGAYRDIDGARWKSSYPLTAGQNNRVEVHLGPSAVSIR